MKLFIIFFFVINIYGLTNISKQWLEKQPRSYEKDFYLSLYLKRDISKDDAIWALGEVKKVNKKLLYPYAKKLKHKETSEVIKCMKLNIKKLVHQSNECIDIGLKLSKLSKLNKKEKQLLLKKIKNYSPTIYKQLKIMNSKIPFIALKKSSPKIFFSVFNSCGVKFRNRYLNHHIPLKLLYKLEDDKYKFTNMVRFIVTNPKLDKLQKSLLVIKSKDLTHQAIFFLAINAIKHNKKSIALRHLKSAKKTAYLSFDKNKILFWQYQLTKNKKILQKLASSKSNDIYSIYAKEKLNIKINNIRTITIDSNLTTNYNYKNPFVWYKTLTNIRDGIDEGKYNLYKNILNNRYTMPHLAYILEKYYKYNYTYLINPYKEFIKDYPIKRQVLINALARQESRFIPTSISTSYAMGVMQIMPFLSKAIAKELHEHYDILSLLDTKTNIKYANHHIDFLERRLPHILFIAYAYNGGIGFVRRNILKKGLFKKGKYEPFLSMELVPYNESKKYGKKVLANYYLYNNYILNKKHKIKFSKLINSIKNNY